MSAAPEETAGVSGAAGRRPRVLVLSNLFPPAIVGGYEIECAGTVELLRRDHEVLVLTSRRGRQEAGAEQGVARLLDFLPHSRVSDALAPLYALRAARTTRRVLREFEPDLVFIWNGAQIPAAAIRVLECSGVPIAYRLCEYWFGRLYESDTFMRGLRGGGALAPLMRLVNRAPRLRLDPRRPVPVAISWISEALREATPVPDTAEVALERVTITSTPRIASMADLQRRPDEPPALGYLGRVDDEKGLDVALRALARLQREHGLEPVFEIAGSGDPQVRRDLEALAAELGIADRVRWLGQIGGDGIRELFARLGLLVVPSVWEEPLGLVVLEAALAGLPLVASRVGGIPEMVGDGEEALLVPPGDEEALAAALRRALADPAESARRAARARQRAAAIVARYEGEMLGFVAAALEGPSAAGERRLI